MLTALLFTASAAQADHALLTEDTGVLGKGTWQLEGHAERVHRGSDELTTRILQIPIVLGYGISERSDLEVEVAYVREVTQNGSRRESAQGMGDTLLAWKWRFYEKGPISLLVRPNASFPTGRDERGLGAGRTSWGVDLVAGYEPRPLRFFLHAGYLRNRNAIGDREPLWHASGAVLWTLSEKVELVLDYGRDTHPDPAASTTHLTRIAYGLSYAVTKDLVVGGGARNGRSGSEKDRAIVAGLKLRF
ncbi:MAG: transporter [Betaproteobacteria bacterium]|nr:transporter [Betaproteobacteria bacterium]